LEYQQWKNFGVFWQKHWFLKKNCGNFSKNKPYSSIKIELFYFISLGSTQLLLLAFALFSHSLIITLYKYVGFFMGAKLFPFPFFNSLHVLVHGIGNNLYSNSLMQKF
jgi:hypothetical protein